MNTAKLDAYFEELSAVFTSLKNFGKFHDLSIYRIWLCKKYPDLFARKLVHIWCCACEDRQIAKANVHRELCRLSKSLEHEVLPISIIEYRCHLLNKIQLEIENSGMKMPQRTDCKGDIFEIWFTKDW